ncbi:DNA pilot protein [Blackfly microvirus SF02]|uniref:DNA pilot protein n=1 Tax=Blackfly microvirus SF02 TaxID=2576452 RepID=A0A4P8PKX0_9VIRU|nr:DNA pilot protein [Blackfly microvirus SF02]
MAGEDLAVAAADAAGTATTGIPWGSVIQGGISLFNGIMGSDSQERTNEANAQQAQKQMDFQERMSNTAHQREVADLEAAHLNPVLSASKGASTPSGAMAVMSSPYQAGVNAATGVSQGALNFAHSAKANQETETERSRTSQEEVKAEQAQWIHTNITKVMEATISKLQAEGEIAVSESEIMRQSIPKVRLELANLASQGRLLDADAALSGAETILKRLGVPEAKAFADMFSTRIGHEIPWAREASGIVSSAAKATAAGAIVNRLRR